MGVINRGGLWPVGTLSGAPWQGAVRRYAVDGATNVCIGDPVLLQANGIATLAATANTDALLGVVVGIETPAKSTKSVQGASLTLEVKYMPKGTAGNVMVSMGADTIYQCLANFGCNVANIGQSGNFVCGDNTTVSVAKISNCVLNTQAPVTATIDGQARIIGIVDRADNTNTHGAAASNTLVEVVLNKTIFTPHLGVPV